MIDRKRKLILAALVLTLLVTVVLADFHHTEKTCKADPRCPACRFQSSSLTVSPIDFFEIPSLRFLAFVEPDDTPAELDAAPVRHSSRAPPQA